ncbi:unnamed protein product, partial [Mesorhabditis belari]|uniref:AB hydrolase-1 domain-containing protein n=1 Tax=Mesorhabditis belari TaxID=2138241 RepID=A0AAF3EMS1_9BILA
MEIPSSEFLESYEEIDGMNIGYCRYGNGPNYMLTVCGAVGCYAKDWPLTSLRHFDPELFTIIGIDPPGYGKSRPPDRKQEVLRCNKDAVICVKLMERLELTPFTIVGWSEGSRTSIHVAETAKGKIERAVLLATVTRVDARGVQVYKGLRNTDQWLPAERAPYLKHYTNEFLKKQWADNCDMVEEAYLMLGGRFPCHDALPKIACPVLMLNGGQDKFCEDPKSIFPKIKNVKLETHLQGGHDFPQKFPKWTAEKITAFVKETARKQA